MEGKQGMKVNPERQRQRFTREFKLEAVRLLEWDRFKGTFYFSQRLSIHLAMYALPVLNS